MLFTNSGCCIVTTRQSGAGKGCRGLNFIPAYLSVSPCARGEPQRGIEMLRSRSIGCGLEGRRYVPFVTSHGVYTPQNRLLLFFCEDRDRGARWNRLLLCASHDTSCFSGHILNRARCVTRSANIYIRCLLKYLNDAFIPDDVSSGY